VLLGDSQPWVDWNWVGQHLATLRGALDQHIQLTFIAVGIGLVISLPLGYAAWRWRHLQKPIFVATGGLYSIPSLALFAFFIPITGLGQTTAEIGLVSYTLLLLVRNVVAGLDAVPPEARDAATGLGYGQMRRVLTVDLPLASPTIIAGVRLAVVTTVGLVSVASYIGAGGGLGQIIYEGFSTNFRTQVVVGGALSLVLAIALDLVLVVAQRAVTPWARKGVRA
jgi:osmoprotectant transport system permease protein